MVSHSDPEQSALHLPEWLGETHWLTTKKKFQGKKMSTEAQMWNYLSLSSTYISSGLSTVPIPTLQIKYSALEVFYSILQEGGEEIHGSKLDISTQALVLF